MPTKLSVNVNAIAMLRNRRDLPWPSVTGLGLIALEAGASGLTVHPRPDQRHVRFSDLGPLRSLINTFPDAEFNIEGYPNAEFLGLIEEHKPDQVTLVPDDPLQATSDHGWDFRANAALLETVMNRLKKTGVRISVFVDGDTDEEALTIARNLGAERIELYTGPYGGCHSDPDRASAMIETLGRTADIAASLGMGVNAGHDLTIANLPPLITRIPTLAEVSIGHALTADALEFGMAETVRRYRRACGQAA